MKEIGVKLELNCPCCFKQFIKEPDCLVMTLKYLGRYGYDDSPIVYCQKCSIKINKVLDKQSVKE